MDQANEQGLPSSGGRSGRSRSPQHLTATPTQKQNTHNVHRPNYNNNIGVQHHSNTTQNHHHHRSHSLESPTHRPGNMDPTGMFRNRGRRSIKRTSVQKNGVVVSSLPSPSRMVGPSSNSGYRPPISPTNNNRSADNQQDRYRTLYDSPQLPQQSLISNVHDEMTTQQQQSSTPSYNDNQYPLQTSIDNNTPYAKLSDKYQSVEATPLQINNSQDVNDSNSTTDSTNDDQAHSTTIGSTVSVMGSLVGDDDDSSNNKKNTKYNDNKLLEVKLRMMRDVQEVVEEEVEDEVVEEEDQEIEYTNMDSQQHESNVVKVADFSQQSSDSVDYPTTSTDQKNTFNNNNSTSYESPFRAAFRRSGMTNHLPISTSESLKRLTPSSSAIDKAANTASILPQLARQCFSFEDTTVDDDNFLIMPNELHMKIEGGETGRRRQLDTHKYYGLSAVADDDDDSPVSSMRNTTTAALDNMLQRNAPKWFPPQRTRLFNEESTGTPFRVINHAQTFDGSSNKRIQHLGGKGLRQTSSFDPWSPQRVRVSRGRVVQPLGNKIESFPKNSAEDMEEVKDWKRIETERGEAIDYLTSIVKHSLCFDQTEMNDYSMEKVIHVANSLKDIKSVSDDNAEPLDHQTKSNVIDVLLRSHEYAMRAKESSLSANEWLKSIDSSKGECMNRDDDLVSRLNAAESNISSKQQEISHLKTEIGRLESSARSQPQQNIVSTSNKPSILSTSSSLSMDNSLVLGSPRVKPCESQDDSFDRWEQDIEKQMNLESRKEVLMLRAALEKSNRQIALLEKLQKEPFSSDIESINASMGNSNNNTTEDICMQIAEDIENEVSDTSTSNDNEDDEIIDESSSRVMLNDPVLEKELEEYRQALLATTVDESRRECSRSDSNTSSDDPEGHDMSIKSNSSDKMINIKMLDGENFITSWNNVDLPPPPDHDLYSPIVDTILEAWSKDSGTRLALVDWIENVLNGSNTDSMPSLKLSDLDHTTRDGFVMHVLPLLLRRKDIHVHLTSRAHRHTSYDIAVRVRPNLAPSFGQDRVPVSEDLANVLHGQTSQVNKSLYAYHATKSGATSINNESQLDGIVSPNKDTFAQPFLGNIVRSSSNAGSISTASAVTSPISNRTQRVPSMYGRTRYTSLSNEIKQVGDTSFTQDNTTPSLMSGVASQSLGDDLSAASSGDDEEDVDSDEVVRVDSKQKPSSIMGSISGAFGKLSRRKPNEMASQPHSFPMPQTPKQATVAQGEGFHRVVSAPPGKIGISFVEYRGYALISNVSQGSPLAGWVFVNDVLIAIDDVPVTGLRTRDIAKLLTDRGDQQRNLRVFSAVALKELHRP